MNLLTKNINTDIDSKKILFNKDNVLFTRIKKNNFELSFTIENNNIFLPKIIDFSLIKLIQDLNKDIYEKTDIQNISSDEINLFFLLQHFFKDVGFPQKFSFVNVKKIVEEDKISFFTKTIYKLPENFDIPVNSELLPVEDMISVCNVITPHKVEFFITLKFSDSLYLPEFVQKLLSIISYKVIKRLKLFIDKLNNNI